MSSEPERNSTGDADDLQFDTAEPLAPPPAGVGEAVPVSSAPPAAMPPTQGVTVCAACAEPITDSYFEANGKVVCPRCKDAVVAAQQSGSRAARFSKATLFGVLAGLLGAAIWYAVRAATGYEVGLIAIVVGLLVGNAVKAGSKGRGGVGYQLLAVLLTYLAIAANYVPDIVHGLLSETDVSHRPVLFVVVTAVMALVAPFLGGIKNVIGIVIIAFGLYQAWIINRPRRLSFSGPYRLAPQLGAVPVGMGYGAPPPSVPPTGRA